MSDPHTEAFPGLHIPTRAEQLALRVVQLGAVAVVLAASTLRPFELDRFFVPKELVLHLTALLAGVLALGAVRRATPVRLDLLLAGFLALSGISALFAANPWLAARALGISVSGVALFWVGRALREAGLGRPLVAGLALAVVLAAAGALLQAYGVETDLFSSSRAPGGTLGNRNFVAHLAGFGFPLILLAALRARTLPGFLLGSAGALLAVGTLTLTRSRAAWLALAAVAAVLLVGALLSPPVRRSGRLLLRFALLLLFAGGGAVAAVTLPNALRWRSESPYLETARGVLNYREGSGRGRLVQYRTSLRMAADHPLLGVGPGNWPVAYPEYAGRHDPSLDPNEGGRTANPWPSSDWVAMLAERGIPAFALLLFAWGALALGGLRRLLAARDAEEGLVALTLIATLVGVMVVGMFDAALLLAWPTLIAWTALGALWLPEVAHPLRGPRALRGGALLLLALLAGLSALRSAGQLASMAIFAGDPGRDRLELAARLDPGNYRVRLQLARSYGRRSERRCEHALAARALFPEADAAQSLARRCD